MKEQGIINYIFSLAKGLPLIIQLMVIPVMIFGYKMLYDAKFREDLLGILIKYKSEKIEVKKLLIHPLFISTPFFVRNIKKLSFNSRDKEYILEMLLLEKLFVIQSKVKNFLSDLPDFNMVGVSQVLKNLIAEITLEYEKKIEHRLISEYGDKCGAELYDFVYINGFQSYSEEHIILLYLFLDHLADSKIPVNYKLYSFLNYFHTVIDVSILKAEKMFKDFNGNIDDIINKYKDK